MGEVDLGLAARWMLLGEVDLLVRPVERSPTELVEGPAIVAAACGVGRR